MWGDGSPVTYTDWHRSSTALPAVGSCISVDAEGWYGEPCTTNKEFICYSNQLKKNGEWMTYLLVKTGELNSLIFCDEIILSDVYKLIRFSRLVILQFLIL